jgi:hypothetical protein
MMDVGQTPCPACGERTLRIEAGWHARPIESLRLSGHQMKFSVVRWPFLVCDSCDLRAAVNGFTPQHNSIQLETPEWMG